MQILLRRASSIAKACHREATVKLSAFETNRDLRLSVHSVIGTEVSNRLADTSSKAMQQLDEILELYQTHAHIRGLIGQANAKVVSPLLAERDTYLKAAEKALNAHLTRNSILAYRGDETDCDHDVGEVTAKLTGIRQQLDKDTTGTINDSVRVPRLSNANRETIRERIATIQRRYIDLSEELAKANFDQTITLPDDVVAILRKHKIVG